MRSDQTIDLGFTTIPITVIKGSKPGPVLALTAGIHGYEYPPILALQRLQVKKLAGTLIIVHVANMPSFLGRTVYFSPLDGKNLNRVFPGKKDGTEAEQIAHAITRGKPAMTVESGFLGGTDEKSTLAILRGVESVMRYLKMIDGKPAKTKPVYLDPAEVLTSPATGILYPHVERNAMVKKA